uniref:Uncharacterized protein n=1 Tax=Desertifilum tharense IPPAS B-1220 TaxID=1781255 RepID=A0ACD5GNF5_9CYAN
MARGDAESFSASLGNWEVGEEGGWELGVGGWGRRGWGEEEGVRN